ncbi:MAG: O-antigen ligase family protein, partial [Candidatus Aureabacteria bacterium]|nr:O-antigen ligase family protein [Candidatus Auribacterota bacterium]
MTRNRFSQARFGILLLLAFLTPLFYAEPRIAGIELQDAFTPPKRYLVYGATLLIATFFAAELAFRSSIRIRISRASGYLAALAAWSCIAIAFAPSAHLALQEAGRLTAYLIIFLAAAHECATPRRIRTLLVASAIAAFGVAVLTLLQFSGINPSALRGGTQRIYASLGNPNYIASYLALILPFGFFGWFSIRRRTAPAVASLALSVVGTAAILATGARGGALALAAGTVAGAYAVRPAVSRVRVLGLILMVLILVLGITLPSPLNRYEPPAADKLAELAGQPRGGIAWRMTVWRVGCSMLRARPIAGWGTGSFELLYPEYASAFLRDPAHRDAIPYVEGGIDYAHNDYLQLWIELGLVGVVLGIGFLASLFRAAMRVRRRSALGDWTAAALIASCAAFLLEALVNF